MSWTVYYFILFCTVPTCDVAYIMKSKSECTMFFTVEESSRNTTKLPPRDQIKYGVTDRPSRNANYYHSSPATERPKGVSPSTRIEQLYMRG